MGSMRPSAAQNIVMIVMIGEQMMNVQNVGQQPAAVLGMPGTAPQAASMMKETASMFDDEFGGGGGDSGKQGAQPAPNPLNMLK
ncbi:unnamed protein product, partial [Symbiodinium sp. KB8]